MRDGSSRALYSPRILSVIASGRVPVLSTHMYQHNTAPPLRLEPQGVRRRLPVVCRRKGPHDGGGVQVGVGVPVVLQTLHQRAPHDEAVHGWQPRVRQPQGWQRRVARAGEDPGVAHGPCPVPDNMADPPQQCARPPRTMLLHHCCCVASPPPATPPPLVCCLSMCHHPCVAAPSHRRPRSIAPSRRPLAAALAFDGAALSLARPVRLRNPHFGQGTGPTTA